uniref:Si:dkey-85k7.12 n=1 Tax=Cyprinodon variegatus TaxID=28743 RepID=A0A3Q2D6R0_CYPVA
KFQRLSCLVMEADCHSDFLHFPPKNYKYLHTIIKKTEVSLCLINQVIYWTLFLTGTNLETYLEDLGLEPFHCKNLSLSEILEINKKTINDEPPKCKSDVPWYFLKKLMMANITARKLKCTPASESNCEETLSAEEFDFDLLVSPHKDESLNPLDIITALFLCSDGFVQQELALKMSMCQLSVPLLLPCCDTKQCTFMLWAMRDIVKKYRPPDLSESKGFIEERIVTSELPMVSFVRLGECSMSKSEILNKLLSNSEQYHDTFVHHNMECGDSPRRISNGLTEITWYLPCGNKSMDIFSEPVAIANLRGDIASFETQFSFLCQTSAAVFVFFDELEQLESQLELLANTNHKSKICLLGNQQSKNFRVDNLKKLATSLALTNSNILVKTKEINDADFVKLLRKRVNIVLNNLEHKMSLEKMSDVAQELGIIVDEHSLECQAGKMNANAITAAIHDTLKFKEDQLPLQGQIWKELTCLEKEEFRLRNVGSENIENYKCRLQDKINELRKKQNDNDMSEAMTCFINAISTQEPERCYFLKWMRMNLDNQSRIKLSSLRERYKEKSRDSENKQEIKEIDEQLSNSSLGVEHFFREMGQIYEASLSLPESDSSRQQLEHLPKLCAQLLLDGLPLELVDGDASSIPLRWVTDVLSQLNDLVSPKNKIVVVTVLGVQSTGKSTLLNTMFGVQFAVSSGRCTRGAFMLLIKVNEDFKNVLNCDFMVIIDTEGLKSPELAQLDNSHEHDNELATLVVGLSDVTIINIAMENSTEMKDILQIVVHAFLRMKEVGKKPRCLFVHQNVSDVSAHEKNLRDRKLLLDQLNEMTQAAAKMEKKEKNKKFTDVMEYNPDTGNCYIPGLWNGNPPMAPVNAGYSEAVYEFKKNIIQLLGKCGSTSNNILEFRDKELNDILVISPDALDNFMVLNNADREQFAYWLNVCVKDMIETLRNKFKDNPFEAKLTRLRVKPQDELFNRVIGCGKQCPFCKIPCDAGGKAHTEHFASLHRPDGLGQYRWEDSEKLTTDICSSLVISGLRFCCFATKNEYHPYKNYKEIFPNWDIRPDSSLEASDYWKYVLVKYNKKFAEAYDAKPADIPFWWNFITKDQAIESLRESFNIK